MDNKEIERITKNDTKVKSEKHIMFNFIAINYKIIQKLR